MEIRTQKGGFYGPVGMSPSAAPGRSAAAAAVLCPMYGIAFGLSVDYEILLLARIVEEHRRPHDTAATATVLGVEHTARVFTAAAHVVAVVMAAPATSGLAALKVTGAGLALAVLLDTTLVRVALVPAFVRLDDRANWRLPPRPRVRRRRWRGGAQQHPDR